MSALLQLKSTARLARYILWPTLALLAPLVAGAAEPAAPRILVVQSGDSPIYGAASEAIREQLRGYCATMPARCPRTYKLEVAILENGALPASTVEAADLVVTLGRRASLAISKQRPSRPTLFALIPRDTADSLPGCCEAGPPDRQQTALVLDQPLERQLRAIRGALPGRKRVGVLLNPGSGELASRLQRLAGTSDLRITTAQVDDPDRVGAVLNDLLPQVDLLLALPDPGIYNRRSIVSILLASYRRRVPVVGFSKAYADAGALFALHTTPEQIGRQIAEMVGRQLTRGDGLTAPLKYPSHFKIAVNTRVAHSLGIELPDMDALAAGLQGEAE